jgi:uncharacterized protein DUF1097
MDMVTALGVSIAVLIAVWTYLAAGVASLPVWVGVVTWGAFFAAGGKTDGMIKTIAASLSGLVWAFIASLVLGKIGGGTLALSVLVGVAAFMMVLQSKVSLLSFIPGAFLGAAVFFGAGLASGPTIGSSLGKVALALVAGAVFGRLSEMLAGEISHKKAETAAAGGAA